MKRKLKTPPQLTKEETIRLQQYIWMQDWHFDVTIKQQCIELTSKCIRWDGNEWEKVWAYGLRAVRTGTNEPCVANFFVRYGFRVYQSVELETVMELISLLVKEAAFDEYRDKLSDMRWKKTQKLIAIKEKNRAKVKKLKAITRKKVA